jgi:hypothetical protein
MVIVATQALEAARAKLTARPRDAPASEDARATFPMLRLEEAIEAEAAGADMLRCRCNCAIDVVWASADRGVCFAALARLAEEAARGLPT